MPKKSASNRTRSRSSTQKRPPKASWFARVRRWLFRLMLKITLWVALIAVLVGSGYLYYLDRSISKTFEGRRWSVPAQVYAQPMELYAGKRLTNAQLQGELIRLGYRKTEDLSTPGSFQPVPGGVKLHLRSFAFMDAVRPSTKITVMFVGNRVQRILYGKQNMELVRLEPAVIGSFFLLTVRTA